LAAGALGLLANEAAATPGNPPKGEAKLSGTGPAPSHPSLVLPPLPYAENALEPYISANTLAVHHGKHHQAYVDKTNALLTGSPLAGQPIEDIVKASAADPTLHKLFNNSAQAWNHSFYWQSLKPKGGGRRKVRSRSASTRTSAATARSRRSSRRQRSITFPNGWVWLVLEAGQLKIVDTHDTDTPLVHGQKPIVVADIWEHAYYLDYKNLRKDYIAGFLDHLLDWDFVGKNVG
jgi:Fe-Mn family superoxide dismutase